MRSIGMPEVLMLFGFFFVLMPLKVVPYWKIFSKAGFSGALSLLTLIPGVELVVMYVVAFQDWPALRPPPLPRQPD